MSEIKKRKSSDWQDSMEKGLARPTYDTYRIQRESDSCQIYVDSSLESAEAVRAKFKEFTRTIEYDEDFYMPTDTSAQETHASSREMDLKYEFETAAEERAKFALTLIQWINWKHKEFPFDTEMGIVGDEKEEKFMKYRAFFRDLDGHAEMNRHHHSHKEDGRDKWSFQVHEKNWQFSAAPTFSFVAWPLGKRESEE
jgi:hypothetical protein